MSAHEWIKPHHGMQTKATVGVSKFRKGARVNMAIICAVSFSVVGFILFMLPSRGADKWRFDLDPFAVIVFTYLMVLNNLQQSYMEFPFLDVKVLTLVVGNLFIFSLSTIMLHAGLPLFHSEGHALGPVVALRLVIWVFSFILGNRAYVWTVQGPKFVPTSGCLSGKYTIITGCNTGIGYLTAVQLAAAAAPDGKIIFACRSEGRARPSMEKLLTEPIAIAAGVKAENLEFMALDVGSMDKVKEFVNEYKAKGWPIDVLLCNAGVIDGKRKVTPDGLDGTLSANCLGHFLLVELLMPILKKTESERNPNSPPRIAMVTSALAFDQPYYDWSVAVKGTTTQEKDIMESKPFSMFPNYAQSKYFQMLTVAHLMRKLKTDVGSNMPVTAIHPGEVLTEVTREFPQPIPWLVNTFEPFVLMLMKSPIQGSQGNVFACTSETLNTCTQCYPKIYMMRLGFIGNAASWENEEECRHAYELAIELTETREHYNEIWGTKWS